MGPSRKKQKTKSPATDASDAGSSQPQPRVEGSSGGDRPSTPVSKPDNVDNTKMDAPSPLKGLKTQLKPKGSWYGTWPRKSTASTSVARETILADMPANVSSSSDLSRFEPRKSPSIKASRPPSMYLGKSKETLDITMGGTMEDDTVVKRAAGPTLPTVSSGTELSAVAAQETAQEPAQEETQELASIPSAPPTEVVAARPSTSSGWLGGWLSKPTAQPTELPDKQDIKTVDGPPLKEQEAPLEAGPPVPMDDVSKSTVQSVAPSSSWFGLWSTAAASTATEEAPKEQIPVKLKENDQDTVMEDAPAVTEQPNPSETTQPAPGSSWAFWSTADISKKPTVGTSATTEITSQPGELAITGEPSQDHPEPAKTATVKDAKKTKPVKRGRPLSTEVDVPVKAVPELNAAQLTSAQSPAPSKTSPPNLLIPSVTSTYRLIENPSIIQQITRLLLQGHQQPTKHVFLAKEAPKIKKALAIGIHGLFPAPLLRTVIGQPTGTSIRFANHGADAIRRWADKNGCLDCEIEKVALEGEGKIADRVDNLWKLLLNWIDHVRNADFVLISCHSQGVPVAIMLIAKLIEFGVVSTGKIGVCAMAGVSLGPFADYKSRLFSGSAGELFEFANPESVVSKRYEDSLRVAVKYGVRITYCGSIDDQLVSMESSIFSTANHPYIYRAVFVDGRIHAPDFLSHLVGFALKLRNLGVSDHGLIRELSAPLAGSLYTGEGHSRLYDDGNVYDLAVEFSLLTTSISDVPLNLQKYEIPTNSNPYVLPWIMRGLLEEDFVKTELSRETTELLKQFDDWKPTTKVLKDVKYRLEAVRSKL